MNCVVYMSAASLAANGYCIGNAKERAANSSSEQIRLLHDAHELLLIHLPIAIAVSLVDHFLKLLVSHALAKLLGNTLQVLERNLSCFVIVEQTERLQDLILGIAIQDFVGHHLKELLVFNGPTSIIVDIGDHLLDLFFLRLEPEGAHRNLELLGVDGAGSIGVEEIEGLLDFLFLLVGELLLLLSTSVEAAKSHSCTRARQEEP